MCRNTWVIDKLTKFLWDEPDQQGAALSPVHSNNKERLGSSSGYIYSTFSN